MKQKFNFEGTTVSYFRRLTFNSNTKWRWMNILYINIYILYIVYTETPHTQTLTNWTPLLQRFLEMSASGGLMTFSGEKFHAFRDEPNRDSKYVHFHTLHGASAHLLPISDSNSSPLIHDRGTAGSPEISGWVRYFPSTRDYLEPASRK